MSVRFVTGGRHSMMTASHNAHLKPTAPASMHKLTMQGPRFQRTMESVQKEPDSGGYVNMSGISTEMKTAHMTKATPRASAHNFSSIQGMKGLMTGTDSSFRLKMSATDQASPGPMTDRFRASVASDAD